MTPSEVRALLSRHGVRPSKALGQNFLVDENTARRIVRLAELQPGERVVEVGPGVGSLTVSLADEGVHVCAIEIDRHLLPILEEVVAGRDVEVVHDDALKVDWRARLGSEPWVMVANLPYNVAATVVVNALEQAPMIERMLVMVQREVGDRFAAGAGDDAYGAVSVKVAYYADAKVVGTVSPNVFEPKPNVESALVRLVRHATPPVTVDAARMFDLVRAGFATRRKTLRNTLAGRVDAEQFERAHVDPGRARRHCRCATGQGWRMRELTVAAFAKLTLSLHVTGTRTDGYHELDATMVSIDSPCDSLVLRPASRTSLTVTGPFAAGVPADATNLAWRAADACGAPVEITLHKGIPSGAGLGGGSADAAAVLVALDGEVAAATRLGADVPFCMSGGFAHVRGIGDQLRPGEVPDFAIVVATPRFGCSTAAVYRAWDELGGPRAEVNDLEPAAEHVEPRLAAFKREVEVAAGATAILAGSGSSYAVLFDDRADAAAARDRVAAAVAGSVWLASTIGVGVQVRS